MHFNFLNEVITASWDDIFFSKETSKYGSIVLIIIIEEDLVMMAQNE